MKIARLPANDRTNGWSAILPPRQPQPSLAGEHHADWIVLGAGYAGLAAARRLAENRPDETVVLVEASAVGENASGRNSGFAIDLPHNVGSSLEELAGSRRYMGLARAAIAHLEEMIAAHDIACDWSRDGKYHAAVTPRGVDEVLKPFADELAALDEPLQWIAGDELAARLGTGHFTAAVYTPGGALMNPAALTRGLAESLPANVTLYENSPVIEADYANGVELKTAEGCLRAPRMIVAANGFSECFGFYPRRFIHLAAHASLTRPLDDSERSRLGAAGPWGLTPANAFAGITMRLTNDHRILIRQNIRYCPAQRVTASEQARVHRHHQRLFDARFPQLAGVDMEYTWTGFLCLSRNSAPGFGQVRPGIWSAVCQNAVGVTKGTISGLLAADLACGRDNPLIADMLALGEPAALPPRPFLDLGVRARFAWEVWSNRHER